MASYNITIFVEGSITTWLGSGGSTSSNAFALEAGDTLNFKKLGVGSVTVSGFGGSFFGLCFASQK